MKISYCEVVLERFQLSSAPKLKPSPDRTVNFAITFLPCDNTTGTLLFVDYTAVGR
jgi:hypothetical protein